jgi:hypothetical protein
LDQWPSDSHDSPPPARSFAAAATAGWLLLLLLDVSTNDNCVVIATHSYCIFLSLPLGKLTRIVKLFESHDDEI